MKTLNSQIKKVEAAVDEGLNYSLIINSTLDALRLAGFGEATLNEYSDEVSNLDKISVIGEVSLLYLEKCKERHEANIKRARSLRFARRRLEKEAELPD